MIRRNPSKIVDSIVNSAHEEHFNVSKAIRDDAPITSMNSVVKSVNFESDGDGAYILRKPLIKKSVLGEGQYISFDKELLSLSNNTLTISHASKIILVFYDNNGEKHTVDTYTGNISWVTKINNVFNTTDHTIISAEINHRTFLTTYSQGEDSVWKWTLVNVSGTTASYKTLTTLKRFLKIYKGEHDGEYILEIVHPELNSITSGLDVGNANTLDVNLLLDNPYAVRDLYGYGYVSATKILPYVVKDEANTTLEQINNSTIWELTESDFLPSEENLPNSLFRLLVSTNTKIFTNNYLILKAFLTTAVTSVDLYCCWEESSNGGVDWDVCDEFKKKFTGETEELYVSDLTSSEFTDILHKESLEKAQTYIVKKTLYKLNLSANDYSQNDLIKNRPDVLVISKPDEDSNIDLSKLYRFSVYINSAKGTPSEEDDYTERVATKRDFGLTNGNIDDAGYIKYKASKNGSTNAPTVSSGKLILHEGKTTEHVPEDAGDILIAPTVNIGNSLQIYTEDPNCIITQISYTLSASRESGSIPYDVGAFVHTGTSVPNSNELSIPEHLESKEDILSFLSPVGANLSLTRDVEIGPTDPITGRPTRIVKLVHAQPIESSLSSTWIGASESLTITCSENDKSYYIFNIFNCLYDVDENRNVSYDTLIDFLADLDIGINSANQAALSIESITVSYKTLNEEVPTTSIYLTSMTGQYQVPYSNNTESPEDLTAERDRIFSDKSQFYYNENQAQLLVYNGNYVYASGTNSAIMKLMNSLSLPETITKIVPWRGYLLLFTERTIYLASYDSSIDGYNIKTLSNTVGVPSEDANTITPILNSIYFKSGLKIYKLVPNLYAASDDILNIHQVSVGVNTILENIVNTYQETHNFSFADADYYMLFIPVQVDGIWHTYNITYDFNRQIWTFHDYKAHLTGIEKYSNTEVYIKDASTLYYFRENFIRLITLGISEYNKTAETPTTLPVATFTHSIPYADYLGKTPKELIPLIVENATSSNSFEKTFENFMTPIYFEIDFGQKSSNYTMDKQFLETKMVLATLSSKDSFPFELDIYTDGISRELHWDANTDSALWKDSLDDIGILNTNFGVNEQDYNGIFRQLIVKYSGRGKSIRHILSGTSKALFKFYSMDVRARILPKKH